MRGENPTEKDMVSTPFQFRGSDVYLLARMSHDGHASVEIFRAEQKGDQYYITTDVHQISCVHSVLYKGPVEEMPETISAEHPIKVKLPGKQVRYFALVSFVQSVAEMGMLALRDAMVGHMLNDALTNKIRLLLGWEVFDLLYCEALAEIATDYPINTPEWHDLASEIMARVDACAPAERSPALQLIADAFKRYHDWKGAAIRVVADEEALAMMYVEHGMPLPGHVPRRIRVHIINPFIAATEHQQRLVLGRIVANLHSVHTLDTIHFPPHWLCKRLQSPFRKMAAMMPPFNALITGGAIIAGKMMGFQDLVVHARMQVLKRIILKRDRTSQDAIVHYWPHYLVRRKASPFRKAMVEVIAYFDVKDWGENPQLMAKALPFEHMIVDHACWRYFRLGFPTENYDFQAEIHDTLVAAGMNDCYYRFVPSTKGKWGIEVFDPWTEAIFPLMELPWRMDVNDPAITKTQDKRQLPEDHWRQTELFSKSREDHDGGQVS